MIIWTWRIGRDFTDLRDKQPETVGDKIRELMAKLGDRVRTGIQDMGIGREREYKRRDEVGGKRRSSM